MAGLGRRTFAAGEVLTASNVMGYLQDQAVMNFAGTAARGSAVPTPSEGMVSYLADADSVEVYNGSAWKLLGGTIAQVISATNSSGVSTASPTYVTTGLSATITPKYSNSKIVVLVSQTITNDSSGTYGSFSLFKDSTNVQLIEGAWGFNSYAYFRGKMDTIYTESSVSTTARVYGTYMKRDGGGGNIAANHDNSLSTIIILEIV